ncbi:hypothetical protein ACMYSN_23830 [Klebsiella sp. R445]
MQFACQFFQNDAKAAIRGVIRDSDSNGRFICPVSSLGYAPLGVYVHYRGAECRKKAQKWPVAEIVINQTHFDESDFDKAIRRR